MTPEQRGWVAGIVEGEGSITRSRRLHGRSIQLSKSTVLIVTSTDPDVVGRLIAFTRVGSFVIEPARRPGYKPQVRWVVTFWPDVAYVLEEVRDLVGQRRRDQIDRFLADPPKVYQRRAS